MEPKLKQKSDKIMTEDELIHLGEKLTNLRNELPSKIKENAGIPYENMYGIWEHICQRIIHLTSIEEKLDFYSQQIDSLIMNIDDVNETFSEAKKFGISLERCISRL